MNNTYFSSFIAWLYDALPLLLVGVGFLFIVLGVGGYLLRQAYSRPIALPPDAVASPLPGGIDSQEEDLVTSGQYVVKPGDSLWRLAEREYGDPYAWVKVYQANKDVIGANPDLILPDTELVMPTVESDTIE